MKTAIVLFNLGGPDSPAAIKPFLKTFFMDPAIIQAPWPVRVLVSSLIARKRSKNEAGAAYGLLGGKSPLLENTKAQAAALEEKLGPAFKVFIAMRYWHPLTDEAARAVLDWNPDEIVLLPLYPQFSTTTTGSSLHEWRRQAKKINLTVPTRVFCCYPRDPGFVAASAENIKKAYQDYISAHPGQRPRVLFSAHGLPEKIIKQGDPYQWQCEESARAIASATGLPDLDWQICYQSRVGPLTWIGPSTEEALHKAAQDKIPVLIYPHAFVSEHVETLVEIEIEYRALAEELGVPGFARVPTVGVSQEFIEGLARMVLENPVREPCLAQHAQCCQRGKCA